MALLRNFLMGFPSPITLINTIQQLIFGFSLSCFPTYIYQCEADRSPT